MTYCAIDTILWLLSQHKDRLASFLVMCWAWVTFPPMTHTLPLVLTSLSLQSGGGSLC